MSLTDLIASWQGGEGLHDSIFSIFLGEKSLHRKNEEVLWSWTLNFAVDSSDCHETAIGVAKYKAPKGSDSTVLKWTIAWNKASPGE